MFERKTIVFDIFAEYLFFAVFYQKGLFLTAIKHN